MNSPMVSPFSPEITILGDKELFPVPDQVSYAGSNPFPALVERIPPADLKRADEEIAAELVAPHRTLIRFTLGEPVYAGAKKVPVAGARRAGTIFTYSVPFEGDVEVLIQTAPPPKRYLKATIVQDGPQQVQFSYHLPDGVADGISNVQRQFEFDHQRLKEAVAQRKADAEAARDAAREQVVQLLRARRAREQGEGALDQEMQAHLNDYKKRQGQ